MGGSSPKFVVVIMSFCDLTTWHTYCNSERLYSFHNKCSNSRKLPATSTDFDIIICRINCSTETPAQTKTKAKVEQTIMGIYTIRGIVRNSFFTLWLVDGWTYLSTGCGCSIRYVCICVPALLLYILYWCPRVDFLLLSQRTSQVVALLSQSLSYIYVKNYKFTTLL